MTRILFSICITMSFIVSHLQAQNSFSNTCAYCDIELKNCNSWDHHVNCPYYSPSPLTQSAKNSTCRPVLYGSKNILLQSIGQYANNEKKKDQTTKSFSQNNSTDPYDYGQIMVVTQEDGILDLAFKTNDQIVYRCYMPNDIKKIFLDKDSKFDSDDQSIYKYAYIIKKDGNTEHIRIKYYINEHQLVYDNYFYLSNIDMLDDKKPEAGTKIYTGYQIAGKKAKGIVKVEYKPTSEPKSYKSMYYFGDLNNFWSTTWVLKPKYDDIQLIEDSKYAFTKKGELYGAVEITSNDKINIITEPAIKCNNIVSVGKSNDQYILLVKRDKHYEWVNIKGEQIAGSDVYDDCIRCYDLPSYVKVQKNKKWGVVDNTSKTILPITFDTKPDYYITRSGVFFGWDVQKNGKMGIIGPNQQEAIPLIYDRLLYLDYSFSDKMRWYAQKDGKWGIIDSLNQTILPIEYEGINSIVESNYIWTVENDSLIRRSDCWKDVENIWIAKKSGKWGLVDMKQNAIVPFIYDRICNFNFNQAQQNDYVLPHAFETNIDGRYGIVDLNGTTLLPTVYSEEEYKVTSVNYPNISFSMFFYNKYHPEQKNILETDAEYNDPQKHRLFLKSLMPTAEREFIESRTSYSPLSVLSLSISDYDEKNERFILFFSRISQEGYSLSVPKSEASAFTAEFNSIKDKAFKTIRFFINHDLLSIGSVTFTTSTGKSYKFVHPQFTKYTGATVLNLKLK